MQLAKINRTNPEQIIMPVTNVDARTLTQGWPVAFPVEAATGVSLNFNNAFLAVAAANKPGFLGIAEQDIATNAVGRVVVWGWAKSILISNVGSSITINAGDPLVPAPAGMFSAAPTYANAGFKYAIASNVPVAVSAAAYASGFLKGGL